MFHQLNAESPHVARQESTASYIERAATQTKEKLSQARKSNASGRRTKSLEAE